MKKINPFLSTPINWKGRMYEFLKKINKLKRTPRMGWLESGIGFSEAEDVAQHSFETATITLVLADLLEGEIDSERALKMAVIHDWAESITGDFSRDMASQIGENVEKRIEEKAMEDLLSCNVIKGENYLRIWKEYTKRETRESRMVFVADRLSILIEASRLFEEGERSKKLGKIWKAVREEISRYTEQIPELEELLKELDEEYEGIFSSERDW